MIVLFLLLCAGQLHTQTSPNYELLTTADGLSQGLTFDILQSRDGFIWIATRDGLNRYDGARFKVFSPDPFDPFAIGGSEVQGLFEDSRGWIWISLTDGLDVLDPVSLHFFHVLHEAKPLWMGGDWRNLAETPDGNIWMTGDGRVWKFRLEKGMPEKALKKGDARLELPRKSIPLPSSGDWPGDSLRVTCILFTQHQKLLIGTTHGVWSLDPGSEKMEPVGLPAASISSMSQDPEGRIWVYYCGNQPASRDDWRTIVWDEKAGISQGRTVPGIFNGFTFDAGGACGQFSIKS